MTLLWIFAALCPLALLALVGFALRIDPRSGRVRPSQRTSTARMAHIAHSARAMAIDHDVIACTE